MLVAAELAQQIALLPLLVLAVLRWRGERRDAALWWLAGVFLVSWVTDEAARWVDPRIGSLVYPVTQAGIVLAVLLPRRIATASLGATVSLAVMVLLWQGAAWPDLLLRGSCWGAIVATVATRYDLGLVRTSLLVSFGLGLLAWGGYTAAPGWTTWGLYQAIRLVGILLFCGAVYRPRLRAA